MLYIVRIQRSVIWNGNVFLQRNCHLPLRYYCIASLLIIPVELYSRNHAHSDDVAFFLSTYLLFNKFSEFFRIESLVFTFCGNVAYFHVSLLRSIRQVGWPPHSPFSIPSLLCAILPYICWHPHPFPSCLPSSRSSPRRLSPTSCHAQRYLPSSCLSLGCEYEYKREYGWLWLCWYCVSLVCCQYICFPTNLQSSFVWKSR